jgi:uncharacterized protein YuzE
MRVTSDKAADAAYIYLAEVPAKVEFTYACDPLAVKGQINLDFGADGRLIGIEVLGASRKLPVHLLEQASSK